MKTTVDTIGTVVFAIIALACVVVMFAAACVLWPFERLNNRGWLGPITVGALIVWLAVSLAGCATAPTSAPSRDPRNPDIWRPTAPAVYPLPR